MNWKDELEDEKGYTICPICFPEYVYCNEDCEHCKGYEERDINDRSNVLSIERIDVNGNYEPNNCKWIPVREQAWNKRNSKMCGRRLGE